MYPVTDVPVVIAVAAPHASLGSPEPGGHKFAHPFGTVEVGAL
jgi:hypothetical protein